MDANNRIDGGALAIYAKLLADSVGLELVIGGDTPMTDGKRLYLPDLDQTDPIAKAIAYGEITHEIGHIQDTSFLLNYAAAGEEQDVPTSMLHLVEPYKRPAIKAMSNTLEDIRIECLAMKKYPGARARLQFMLTELLKQGYWVAPNEQSTPGACLRTFIGGQMRTSVLKQKGFEDIAAAAYALCLVHLPRTAMARLGGLLLEVTRMRSSEEVVELAIRIEQMLKEEAEKPLNGPSPQQGQGQSAQQQGQGQSAQQQGQGQSGQGQQAEGGAPQSGNNDDVSDAFGSGSESSMCRNCGENEHGSSNPQSSAGGDWPQGIAEDQATPEQQENLKKILSGDDAATGGIDVGQIAKFALNKISHDSASTRVHLPQAAKRTERLGTGAAVVAKVLSASNALHRKTSNLLQAESMTHIFHRASGSRIDTHKIPGIVRGDFRVFEHETEGVSIDTAVMLLLDNSYSMAEGAPTKISIASDAVLAAFLAYSKTKGVKIGAAAFPYHIGNDKNAIQVLADIGESSRKSAPRFSGIKASGTTPLAEAALFSGYQLMSRKEARKILIVATDGEPNSKSRAMSVIEMLRNSGVEVIAIGINSNASEVFGANKSVRIEDVSDLCGAMFSMLNKLLLKQAA